MFPFALPFVREDIAKFSFQRSRSWLCCGHSAEIIFCFRRKYFGFLSTCISCCFISLRDKFHLVEDTFVFSLVTMLCFLRSKFCIKKVKEKKPIVDSFYANSLLCADARMTLLLRFTSSRQISRILRFREIRTTVFRGFASFSRERR